MMFYGLFWKNTACFFLDVSVSVSDPRHDNLWKKQFHGSPHRTCQKHGLLGGNVLISINVLKQIPRDRDRQEGRVWLLRKGTA